MWLHYTLNSIMLITIMCLSMFSIILTNNRYDIALNIICLYRFIDIFILSSISFHYNFQIFIVYFVLIFIPIIKNMLPYNLFSDDITNIINIYYYISKIAIII
jgi:hypothetical protein